MKRRIIYIVLNVLLVGLAISCSTEKNTAVNRAYHGLNAHYNGYFNANELINQSMNSYRANVKEDYYNLLPIELVPNEKEVEALYPAIDTAIVKCKKVITDHSMPSNDRPSKKKEEHNAWIDENWTTIGIANYYRRDYEAALKSFLFVKKFYSNDPSLFIGELWMAKTNIQKGKLTEAKFNLDNLDKAIENEQNRKKEKSSKSKKSKKKSKKEDKIAKFPKKIRFDFEVTKANLALKREEKDQCIAYLEESLKHARKASDKGRVNFILGQLYEEQGNRDQAQAHYAKSRKYNIPYEMSFNARLKSSLMGGGEKVRKDLNKMLRDAKNAEFKDQIYYTLAQLDLNDGNEPKAKEHLTLSAFYSTSNTRQKGMAYEKLADLSFTKRDYIVAQKYYDSCANVIADTYPNAEGIRNKATKLADLVVAVETANYEDSVQRVAAMDPDEREKFIKEVIKKTKEEEERRKEREAAKLRELQQNSALFAQDIGNSSKWYWNNTKTREEGYNEFQRLWGERENEDHWRRSDKTVIPNINDNLEDSLFVDDSTIVEIDDTLTVEYLSQNLPLSEESLQASTDRLVRALYDAGIIYKEQLNEDELASNQFNAVLDRKAETEYNLMSAFQLYKLNEVKNKEQASVHKSYILNNYPNSDYANFLRDPDYFIKKKERDALAEQEYVKVLDRYGRGLYYPVISKANQVIDEEKDNIYRAKYMLLKALSTGQTTERKEELLPILNQVLEEYPETSEAARAQEMIDVIKNGYSKNIEANFESNFIFEYEDGARQLVIVILGKDESVSVSKNKVSDFNREYFPKERIKVSSKLFGTDQSIVLLQDFETEADAKAYVRKFKSTRKYLLDLQNAKTIIITAKNMKLLFETLDLNQYEAFYDEFY